ncbi:MAG: transcriptional repressor LexA [Gammaproteobacteria bacterium]|nr:transcriptional repressor LexA [Gammaproteobacteria bacterium]
MEQLTDRQTQVLAFIKEYMADEGLPPTRVEIASALGFRSPNAAEDHIKALVRKGAIEVMPGMSRGIRILGEESVEEDGLPLIGRVAAGSPIFSEAHVEHRYALEPTLFHPPADYLLRVRGMSMRDAGILEGDMLAVHRTNEAKNGDLVVARLDDEVTVKRFERKGSRIFLHPENPDFSVIEVNLNTQELDIEGIGVGIIRNGSTL